MSMPEEFGNIWLKAFDLAFNEFDKYTVPIRVPQAWLANYLMYRAGVSVDVMADLAGCERRQISHGIALVAGFMRYPSFAQAVTALVKQMPSAPAQYEAEIVQFPRQLNYQLKDENREILPITI